ncbi:MAG: hypothetical protein ACHQ9S_18635 [Candidatus Binatia bacterium]
MSWTRRRIVFILSVLSLARAAYAVPTTVSYGDPEGQGFFDPVLGAARRNAFEFATGIWANTLAGTVPIVIAATMPSLGGNGSSALFASSGAVTFHRNFSAGVPNTWYAAALANELSGTDLNGPNTPEISIMFNADVDSPEVLGSIGWYYGTDAQPGTDIDFVTIALHELAHGLNFADLVDVNTGGWLNNNQPGIFDRMLFRPLVGSFADLRDAERLAAVVSDALFWNGPNVVAFNGGPAAVYAPDPSQPGSSVSHWDPASNPHELMVPFYTEAVHDPGLLLPALIDMGWGVTVPTPTPRASAAPPTATPAPRSTIPPAEGTPPPRRDVVYVTNFDDGTVSLIDRATSHVTGSIPVGDGPLGMAATTDGRRLYVANFRVGTVSVLSTRANRVLATIRVGDSANGVAVTPDGAFVVVTDTASDRATIVDTASNAVTARMPAGPQPSGVAITPDGALAFVADYGTPAVAVIDIAAGVRRAIIPTNPVYLGLSPSGTLSLAMTPGTGSSFATIYFPGSVLSFDATNMVLNPGTTGLLYGPTTDAEVEAVALSSDGSLAYVTAHTLGGAGQLLIINTATSQISTLPFGHVLEGVALSSDEQMVYVADAGSNSVLVKGNGVVISVPVGAAPMGVVVAAVPQMCQGDCNGDGVVTVDEVLQAVNIALGLQAVNTCIAVDGDDDGRVTVDEVLQGVTNYLSGCPLG